MKPPKRLASTGGSFTGSGVKIGGSVSPGSSGAGGSGSPPPSPGSTGSTGILWSSLYLY
ncbi:hypothetical protein [Flavobacterium sp. UGB4466]|uniref:hypothetical protein n=1 Tax=Flavobacterium sp. UGB4466 TaxID=2730889 RepID=UPI00192B5AA3|nr:hypothetical protein [Flavobacterium sp. UGB4466]